MALTKMVEATRKLVQAEFKEIDSLVQESKENQRFDSPTTKATSLFARLRKLVKETFQARNALIAPIFEAVHALGDLDFDKQADVFAAASGFGNVPVFKPIPRKARVELLQSQIRSNVRLIKSLGDDSIDRVESIVLRAIREGRTGSELADEIEQSFDVSRSRAQLIARDQIGKVQGEHRRLRHRAAGFKTFQWNTEGDDRVRPEHEARDQQVFTYEEPAGFDYPGQAVNCRCWESPFHAETKLPES